MELQPLVIMRFICVPVLVPIIIVLLLIKILQPLVIMHFTGAPILDCFTATDLQPWSVTLVIMLFVVAKISILRLVSITLLQILVSMRLRIVQVWEPWSFLTEIRLKILEVTLSKVVPIYKNSLCRLRAMELYQHLAKVFFMNAQNLKA